MIELACKNCGGKLSSSADDIFVGNGTAIVRHNATVRCGHCGAQYLPGQELVLRDSHEVSKDKTVRTVHYKVRSGDSLYLIAQKFSVSIADVRRWNNLTRNKHLQPGQNLKLYVDVTQLTRNGQG